MAPGALACFVALCAPGLQPARLCCDIPLFLAARCAVTWGEIEGPGRPCAVSCGCCCKCVAIPAGAGVGWSDGCGCILAGSEPEG